MAENPKQRPENTNSDRSRTSPERNSGAVLAKLNGKRGSGQKAKPKQSSNSPDNESATASEGPSAVLADINGDRKKGSNETQTND